MQVPTTMEHLDMKIRNYAECSLLLLVQPNLTDSNINVHLDFYFKWQGKLIDSGNFQNLTKTYYQIILIFIKYPSNKCQ